MLAIFRWPGCGTGKVNGLGCCPAGDPAFYIQFIPGTVENTKVLMRIIAFPAFCLGIGVHSMDKGVFMNLLFTRRHYQHTKPGPTILQRGISHCTEDASQEASLLAEGEKLWRGGFKRLSTKTQGSS